jgi:two-component sensor histidine kinase
MELLGASGMANSSAASKSQDRLSVLQKTGLLDSPPEPAFDRVTRFATRLLGVPVSLVSLVDADRQFFKSAVGLPEPWASLRETPLTHSFCKHVVPGGTTLVVEDSRIDSLVRENLAIRDLGVISYLGAPLITRTGYVLGALCAIDSKPRAWTAEDIANLNELAGIVMSEIALRGEITLREKAEHQQHLLARELHHRVKNTLAMVEALVLLNLRTAENFDSFRDGIRDRIQALSNTHTLLIEHQWGSVSLLDLIGCEFKPFAEARVTAEGPNLEIPAQAALHISMALHELLTNAIKYGALAVPAGRVRITWSIAPEEHGTRLELKWTESGGPPVAKPAHRGFGTSLLERLLGEQMDGRIETDYAAKGLRAQMSLLVPSSDADNPASQLEGLQKQNAA